MSKEFSGRYYRGDNKAHLDITWDKHINNYRWELWRRFKKDGEPHITLARKGVLRNDLDKISE